MSQLYSKSIDRDRSQYCGRQSQKQLGRLHRAKFVKRARHKANRRTGRQLNYNGLVLVLWNEDVNRLGEIDPNLAMRVSMYAWASSDAQRAEYKRIFWNSQKGDMKRDFRRAGDLLMDIHGGTLSAEGRVIVWKN